MRLNPINHQISPATFVPSPNFDQRPCGQEVDLLVIHNISLPPGEFGTGHIQDLFLNQLNPNGHPYYKHLQGLRVSSHLLIDRQGQLTQFVPLHMRAWHAGVSRFNGRYRCNDFSIGIELEGTDTVPYTHAQYHTLVQVSRIILHHYPKITLDRIIGHQHIAHLRKTDPGPFFRWNFYKNMLQRMCPNDGISI